MIALKVIAVLLKQLAKFLLSLAVAVAVIGLILAFMIYFEEAAYVITWVIVALIALLALLMFSTHVSCVATDIRNKERRASK